MQPQDPRLPNGLLIILHLHLLNYPLQDATGYDERLFDAARGMRERNKAMEDISYFLVGKIERSKERAKSANTTAFRIALAKYVEAIRNSIVHTTHAGEKPTEQKAKQPASPARDEIPAWWWRDIVVRKSILDECCGERFERLILALSSHAILKNTNPSQPLSTLHPLPAQGHAILDTLPQAYTARLAAAQSERLEWERSAALLVQRQADLTVIRARLADPRHASSSKYDALDTARLLAQRDSRLQDLIRGTWVGDEGRRALQLVTALAGLVDPATGTASAPAASAAGESGIEPSTRIDHRPQASVAAETPPLPIAAARHPSHLHALSAPLFPDKKAPSSLPNEVGDPSGHPHAITERLAAVQDIHRSLQEALLAAQGIHTQLLRGLQKAKEREAASRAPKGRALELTSSLWAPRKGEGVVFKLPEDAATLLPHFGLESPSSETAIEERIAHIRTALLPPFTAQPLPPPSPEPEPEVEVHRPASRLPQPSRMHAAGRGHATSQPEKSTQRARPPQVGLVRGGGHRDEKPAQAASRRLSRRASAARARRSTVFGRGEDAELLRIVASIEDRSDSEDSDAGVEDDRGLLRTPARTRRQQQHLGTRGTLLSSVKKGGPRQSYDIAVHERAAHVPRLPSLRLSGAPELDEDGEGPEVRPDEIREEVEEDGDEEVYEGNSMTLADILMHAGHQGNTSLQILGEEMEDEMSDWE
ncbi:hypothetical protein TRAPUB_11142 [Trametes pubescens]|uniref:HAUS augmin-like complex subunit 6 N-terminal domain-containing protein n=1 Tax=Trametes pubescens TaxID=154538 RepID=A0A1M2VXJ6_TRAPU|nr:hypothetical protein TRAPUB_11142 [Trametes pubescens]